MVTRKSTAARHTAAMTQAQVERTLDNLYEIYTRLDRLDPANMSGSDNDTWTDQYTKVTKAMRVLENKSLAEINAGLKEDADQLTNAIDDAETALHGIQDAATVLQTVGNVLKFVAAIASVV